MMQPPSYAIAFDMDGVIFRTTRPKHDAMLSLFPGATKEVASDEIMSMSGVPRGQKLTRVYERCFGRTPSGAELQALLQKYEVALRVVLADPVVTPGIKSFLERSSSQCFVCSSAPLEEVERQLQIAGLEKRFERAYGAPTSKTQALQDVSRRVGHMDVVFFGDATADLKAAKDAGCAFVAVVGETDQFPESPTPRVADFVNDVVVLDAINCALVANAA
ncbi:MAG TPA: HAD hydrolase-like protein [Rhodoferax sp.]|jgi:phosphoglycolate phosphatase-like HAD superfamily hydrolase|nr:HAD hydrolase-like protein [Rhodoferax sp.]HNV58306.1 HAD hydrolase-like protein [Rhodoferax sp.]HPW28255.1 HAD hydrolase-like protein [Rhodoferax sp.]